MYAVSRTKKNSSVLQAVLRSTDEVTARPVVGDSGLADFRDHVVRRGLMHALPTSIYASGGDTDSDSDTDTKKGKSRRKRTSKKKQPLRKISVPEKKTSIKSNANTDVGMTFK